MLVMATPLTLGGGSFSGLLQKHKKSATVVGVSAPEIVRLVEEGKAQSEEMERYVEQLLAPYRHPRPDAVVLGCTHFPFAIKAIRRTMGAEIPIFDGAEGTARQLARTLETQGLLNPSPRRGAVTLTSSAKRILPMYAELLFDEA